MFYIKNAYEIYVEKTIAIEELGIYTPNSETLMIELEHFTSNIFYILSLPIFGPIRKNSSKDAMWFSNGAYHIDNVNGKDITVKKNYHHFEANSTNLDFITFKYIKEFEEQEKQYINNAIQITCNTNFPFEKISEYTRSEEFHTSPLNIGYYLMPNLLLDNLFSRRNNRNSLLKSIDKTKIALDLSHGVEPLNSFVPGIYDNYNGNIKPSSEKIN